MRGTRAQLTRRGLVVAFVVVLVGGLVFGGAVFGFGLGDSGDRASGTPTVAPGTTVESSTSTTIPTPTNTGTVVSTPTVTPTETATVMATPFPVPSETVTPTPEQTSKSEPYEEFINAFLGEMAEESDVPIRARGGAIIDGELWIMYNATDPTINDTRRVKERGGFVTGYVRAYQFYHQGQIDGKLPTGLRVLEVNNTNQPPKTFLVSNLVAEDVRSGSLDGPELVEAYYSTLRNQTERENQIVIENDKQGDNITYGPDGNVSNPEY